MDLLGSILGSMEKPPEDAERKKVKAQQAAIERVQQQEKQKLNKFRSLIQQRIEEFVKDCDKKKMKFEPMDKNCRAIAHEVADVAGLSSFSFGQEEIDRYVMVWKKEFAPCDDEINAYRNNEEWSEEKARLKKEESALSQKELSTRLKNKKEEVKPIADYHSKYEHLLGKETAKDAARVTHANKSYGFVPSENKRDHRTIEEVMADTKARKRQKVEVTQIVAPSDPVTQMSAPNDPMTSYEIEIGASEEFSANHVTDNSSVL